MTKERGRERDWKRNIRKAAERRMSGAERKEREPAR